MKQGQIVTFYSYKGGVGRTMALANVAVLLTQWGYKTLIVDWDLEAPGLEYFFNEQIDIENVKSKKGLVDLLHDVFTNPSAIQNSRNWKSLIVEINLNNSQSPLHILTAGERDNEYFNKVRNFDVENFYSEKKGGQFIEHLRNEWKKAYDFVLIDSRTGITDIGGICTIQLPDTLVLLFTATEQGLKGIIDVTERALEGRQELPVDRLRLLSIPIPSKFDTDKEFKIAQSWLEKFTSNLSEIYSDWLPKEINIKDFLEVTKLPYISYFSFGEKLAVEEQGVNDPAGLGYAYETLAAMIANELESVERVLTDREKFILDATLKPAIRKSSSENGEFIPNTQSKSATLADQLYERALDFEKEDFPEKAIDSVRKAIEIWQDLIKTDFSKFGHKLAKAKRLLSDYYNRESDIFGAIAEGNSAVDIYRRLHENRPSEFEEELGIELLNLSNLYIVTNQFMDAFQVSNEAVSIYRQLANNDRNKFMPDLASSLNIMSECLFNIGNVETALKTAEEAIQLFSSLSVNYPKRFDTDLASSINNLLDQISQLSMSEMPYIYGLSQQAIDTFREIANRNEKRYLSDLAKNLNVLTDLLLNYDKLEIKGIQEALSAQKESISIFRRLAQANPALYDPELARSLINLSKINIKIENVSGAVTSINEAIAIFKKLSKTNSSRYKEEMDEALKLLNKLNS